MIEVERDGKTRQCASIPGEFELAETRRISCMRGTIGSIVKVRHTTKTPLVLTLCEVEVYGMSGKTKRCL